MRQFIKNQLFYCVISSLVLFVSCNSKDSSRGREGRDGGHDLCEEAKLSEEQRVQMRELRQKHGGSRELSREERQEAWQKAQQEILEKVPTTEEQKQALSECFERRKNRRGRHNSETDEKQ